MTDTLQPPRHLRAATRRWFSSVAETFNLEPHHIHLLRLACENLDRCNQAREILATEGLTYVDRFGCPRPRPEVGIARDCAVIFSRLVRELGLDSEVPQSGAADVTPIRPDPRRLYVNDAAKQKAYRIRST